MSSNQLAIYQENLEKKGYFFNFNNATLESEYRQDRVLQRATGRIIMYMCILSIFLIAYLFGHNWLGTVDGLIDIYHYIELRVIFPLCLAGIYLNIAYKNNPSTSVFTGLSMLGFFCSLLVLKYYEVSYHLDISIELLGLVLIVGTTMAGVRTAYTLLGIAIAIGLVAGFEWGMFGYNEKFRVDFFYFLIFSLFAVLIEIHMNNINRRSWIQSKIIALTLQIDALSGLPNRNLFNKTVPLIIKQAIREEKGLTVMILDLDYFKSINDYYGHIYGDSVIAKVGKTLNDMESRPLDFKARVGGEEFCILLYDATQEGAENIAKTLLNNIARMNIENIKSPYNVVTASIGIFFAHPKANTKIEDLIHQADLMLYRAKNDGKNKWYLNNQMNGLTRY